MALLIRSTAYDVWRFCAGKCRKYHACLAQLCTLLACLTPLLRDEELREKFFDDYELDAPRFCQLLAGRVNLSLDDICFSACMVDQPWRRWRLASPVKKGDRPVRHGTRDAPAMLLALDAISLLVFWPQMQMRQGLLLARKRELFEPHLTSVHLPPVLRGKVKVKVKVLLECVSQAELHGVDEELPAKLRVGVPHEGDLEILLELSLGTTKAWTMRRCGLSSARRR